MNYEELMSIKVIPKDIAKSQSKSLVNNLYHTPYKDEIRLFSCIKQGNLKKLIFEMTQLGIQSITVGQMSDDELKQQKYMAVSFITLATRYAIQGGMNENNAYSFSEWITSITASAWDRSILPFKNARFVNSPGSASRAPHFTASSRIRFITRTPP